MTADPGEVAKQAVHILAELRKPPHHGTTWLTATLADGTRIVGRTRGRLRRPAIYVNSYRRRDLERVRT